MPKKYRLESQYDSDFTLIGIISHQRDYRLIWSINNQLQLNMIKMDDLKIFQDKKNENNFFSFYYYDDINTFKTYFFISNSGQKGLLFPEYKQTN
ncbi:MAG TPA: IPExxxVDY family protein, partial [Bacteroidales bacterium]|nr:IPExxxVDY family protein [Bacteroidales bacterium]